VAAPLFPRVAPGAAAAFAAAFLPPRLGPELRPLVLSVVLGDAAIGGLVALGLAGLALLAARGALRAAPAAWLTVGILAADLLRTGAGLNPMVSAGFYRPSPELEAHLGPLREGRAFTCSVETSPAYLAGRAARGSDHETWSFAALLETLTPAFNVPLRVPTAFSPDLTMLVPTERVLTPEEGSCRDLPAILPRLRAAAVTRVISLDPLPGPDLEPEFTTTPARIAPLAVHVYRLRDPLPRIALAGRGTITRVREGPGWLEIAVDAGTATTLVVRDTASPGWAARVGGEPRPLRAPGRELAVDVPSGQSEVRFEYRPSRLGVAWGASLASLATLSLLAGRKRRRDDGPPVPP